MEIEARGGEGTVVGVAVGGFEVASGVEAGGVPKAASEIGNEGKRRPELGYLGDEHRVMVNGEKGVV